MVIVIAISNNTMMAYPEEKVRSNSKLTKIDSLDGLVIGGV